VASIAPATSLDFADDSVVGSAFGSTRTRVVELYDQRPRDGDYARLSALLDTTYETAPCEDELAWWFRGNPVGPEILSLEEGGASGMSLFRLAADRREFLAAFVVHSVTDPQARGRGIFSRLQLANEARATTAGAALALGFTTKQATRLLVGRLGWTSIAQPRIWVRLRLRKSSDPPGGDLADFHEHHEQLDLDGPAHLLKDARWLDWRYRDSPRSYRLVETAQGWATVGVGRHRGLEASAICELHGGPKTLRAAVHAFPAPVVFAMPAQGEEALYAGAGFVPTPKCLRFIGKSLDPAVPLPRTWRLGLGDTDFF
jgi:GNAT superfamily N-acetyltransferase